MVQAVGGSQSGRAATDHRNPFAVAHRLDRLDVALAEGGLHDGGLILADGDRLVTTQFQHATLLAECGADAPGELGEVISLCQDMVGLLVSTFVEHVLPLRLFVA